MEALGEEFLKGHLKVSLQDKLLPQFWSHFDINKSNYVSLQAVSEAVSDLTNLISFNNVIEEMKGLYPLQMISGVNDKWEVTCKVLGLSIWAWLPKGGVVFRVMESLVKESLIAYETTREKGGEREGEEREGEEMETETHTDQLWYWNEFQSLVAKLSFLGLRDRFLSHSTVLAIENKVKDYVTDRCSDMFYESFLGMVTEELQDLLSGWLNAIYGDISKEWSGRILHHIYNCYGRLRIRELFDIIVDFPDSESVLVDLRECLHHVDLREELMDSLTKVYESRLLHHGANTSDIITQYISSVRSLKLLDPTGVVLERVCEPVKAYLRTRSDTVTCIMASLIDDSNNDLSEELAKGETVLLDLSDEYDDPDQDFEAWEPDPVDADPMKSSKSRQTSDIISLLVHIYGGQDLFVNEYRTLLSDRLLLSLDYDVTRELRNLELLKLRFGEGNLHYCEVMIKDITDSRRVNGLINNKLSIKKQQQGDGGDDHENDVIINSFILSHIFWPSFRIETMKLPAFIQKKLDDYNKSFQEIKGMRELKWCHDLGQVQLELEVNGQILNFQVSPSRASVIWQFQNKSVWSVEDLSTELESTPSVIRRHLLYWAGQGVLCEEKEGEVFKIFEKEGMDDTYHEGGVFEEESAMSSMKSQKENDLEVVWSYVTAMLTNLGPMSLDKIHNMLSMFMLSGPGGGGGAGQSSCTVAELKACLDKKVKGQELMCTGGVYQLCKNN